MKYSILLMATPALAFWRMECRGVVGDYRVDPLMSPGEVSQHLHAIVGAGGFSPTATNDDLLASDCTSCLVTQDKSAYWHPALYFHDTDKDTYELVGQEGGMLAYYLLNSNNGDKISAFPAGFRMIAGDNDRRAFSAGNFRMVDPPKSDWAALNQTTQDALAQRALGFNCLDYSKDPEGSLQRHYLPSKAFLDANCPDGIRFELMFPQCWDGASIDAPNHKDHVAYPDLVMQGACPDSHPTRLPGLFYETIWATAAFAQRTGEFVISNGDRQGFSYHGDFMMGWDEALLQKAVDTCTNPSGLIEDCAVFDIQSQADAQACKMQPPAVAAADNVGADADAPATALPGGLAVFGDLFDGVMDLVFDELLATTIAITNTGAAAAATSSPISSPTSSLSSSATDFLGHQAAANVNSVAFSTSSSSSSSFSSSSSSSVPAPPPSSPATSSLAVSTPASTPASTVPATPTVTPQSSAPTTAPPPPSQTNTRVFSTQYITNGGVVQEILWEQTTEYVTVEPSTEWTTTTVTADGPAVRRRHGHMRRHQRRG